MCFKRIVFDCKRMSVTKKSYTLGKIKQLIDLNGDSTNFDLSFTVTCQDETPFKLLVVDQTTLDNTPELEYKETKTTISGNIVADKNVYQNYFLILKSENPCVVDVELVKKELPKTPEIKNVNFNDPETTTQPYVPAKSSIFSLKNLIIAVVVVVGIYILYRLYTNKSNSEEKEPEPPTLGFEQKPAVYGSPHSFMYNSSKHNSPEPDRTFRPTLKYAKKIIPNSPIANSPSASMRSDDGGESEGLGNDGLSLLERLRRCAHN